MGGIIQNSATFSGFYDKGYLFPASRNVSSSSNAVKGDLNSLKVKYMPRNNTGRIMSVIKSTGPVKKASNVQKIYVVGEDEKPEEDLSSTKVIRHGKDKGHHSHHSSHGSHGGSSHHGGSSNHESHSEDEDCDYNKHKHKGGHGHHHKGGHHGGHKGHKGGYKKFMIPMMVGLITAKAILVPLILKAVTFMAAKGLLLGLIATIMATILSLRKMMEPSWKIEGKKDDVTKIEVVPVPIHEKEHHYVSDHEHDEHDSYNPYRGYYR